MKKKSSRRCFTLLEILLCISLLSLIGGLFAVRGKELFDIYLFRQDVSKMNSCLDFAKHSAFSYQADVEVLFFENEQGVVLQLVTDEPALATHPFFSQPYSFKHVKSIDCFSGNEKLANKIMFSSSGWIFPLCDLRLQSRGKGQSTIRSDRRVVK